jgi:hypothetical protein
MTTTQKVKLTVLAISLILGTILVFQAYSTISSFAVAQNTKYEQVLNELE